MRKSQSNQFKMDPETNKKMKETNEEQEEEEIQTQVTIEEDNELKAKEEGVSATQPIDDNDDDDHLNEEICITKEKILISLTSLIKTIKDTNFNKDEELKAFEKSLEAFISLNGFKI